MLNLYNGTNLRKEIVKKNLTLGKNLWYSIIPRLSQSYLQFKIFYGNGQLVLYFHSMVLIRQYVLIPTQCAFHEIFILFFVHWYMPDPLDFLNFCVYFYVISETASHHTFSQIQTMNLAENSLVTETPALLPKCCLIPLCT